MAVLRQSPDLSASQKTMNSDNTNDIIIAELVSKAQKTLLEQSPGSLFFRFGDRRFRLKLVTEFQADDFGFVRLINFPQGKFRIEHDDAYQISVEELERQIASTSGSN